MSKLDVNWKKLSENGKEMEQLSEQLKNVESRLEDVKSNLCCLGKYGEVTSSITCIIEGVSKEAKSAKEMGNQLEEISSAYKKIEAKIVSNSVNNVAMKVGKKKADKKGKDDEFDWEEFLEKLIKSLKYQGYSTIDLWQISKEVNKGIFSSLFNGIFTDATIASSFEEWLMGFVQNNIHDESFLAFFNALAFTCPISEQVREEHLENNEIAWSQNASDYCDTNNKYIEHQSAMDEILFGEEKNALAGIIPDLTGKENTCEVIAAYNALVAMNGGQSPESFPQLLNYFEENGIALYGYFGTSPDAIETYFSDNGYETKMLSGNGITSKNISNMQSDYDTYIITVYNDKDDIMGMVHTMCITEENGQYVLHNDYSGKRIEDGIEKEHFSTYSSLEEAIKSYNSGKSEPISVIGIANL